MVKLKVLLTVFFITITIYTGWVIAHHGLNLFPVFFGELQKLTWQGQFNLDFACLLMLSGLWISWRHQFSFGGIVLGLFATVGGMMFITPYLIVTIIRNNGNLEKLLLGERQTSK